MSERKIKQPSSTCAVNVPIVMQMEALECGAASLAMVLAYYEKWIPLEQVREDCGVSRNGSNAKNILNAARNYGMQAKAYKFSPESLKKNGKFPMIVHWEFNHFVVFEGVKGVQTTIVLLYFAILFCLENRKNGSLFRQVLPIVLNKM